MDDLIAWTTGAVALIALVVSIWTSREMRRQTTANEVNTIDALHVSVSQAYIDYPEMRAVFYEGENGLLPEEMSRADKLRAAAIAEMLCDSMERSLSGDSKGIPEVIEPVRAWVDDMLRHSGYLRFWLRSHAAWYQGPLVARLGEMEEEPPDASGGRGNATGDLVEPWEGPNTE